jgi:hypothetical protein
MRNSQRISPTRTACPHVLRQHERMIEVVEKALSRIAHERPLFHSEADFQHALAWQIQSDQPTANVRLERRMSTTPRVELDLLVELDGGSLAIELKYPRAALTVELGDEAYDLRLGAADVESYAVVKDIWRLERLVREGVADEGCAVVVTNHQGIWEPSATGRETLGDAFRLTDGTVLSGLRAWRPTDKKWPGPPIELAGCYALRWRSYATVPGIQGSREFRYLLIAVRDGPKDGISGEAAAATLPRAPSSPDEETVTARQFDQRSTAGRGRAMAVRALEDAGFAVTEGETRRNRLTVSRDDAPVTVWVATRKGLRYPFWVKSDWQPHERHFACLVRLPETAPGEIYVIPTTVWAEPDGVFVSRDYVGRGSPPEWGINLSAKNLPALLPYRMPDAARLLP